MLDAKQRIAAMSVICLALVAAILCQEQRAKRLTREIGSLREEVARLQSGKPDELLSDREANESAIAQKERELLRLRGQVTLLRAQLLQASNSPPTPAQSPRREESAAGDAAVEQYRQDIALRAVLARDWMDAFRQYAVQNRGQFPTNFDQAEGFLRAEAKSQTNVSTGEFEIVYRGSLDEFTNLDDVIVIRERQVRHRYDGKRGRVYGLADGASLQRFFESESALAQWEQEHLPNPGTP